MDAWRQLRDRADPNRDQYWFGGTDNFGYLDVYDALYYFDITWESRPGAAMASYGGRLDRYNQGHPGANKPFIATVMPGYDDIKVRNGHRRDRANGDYYRGTWQTVIDRNAAGVILTSFNEFFEGSHIEPSEQYGDLYLRLTKELSDRYHSAQPAAPRRPLRQCPAATAASSPRPAIHVCGRILEYWNENGGLPVFGFPIADQTSQQIEGKPLQLQWFERNRLELHPENARPYDVLLGRLGADSLAAQKRDWNTFGKAAPIASTTSPRPATRSGRSSGATGRATAWSSTAEPGASFDESLALFGLPLSEPVIETNPTDGKQYLTQHFERARFEYPPRERRHAI